MLEQLPEISESQLVLEPAMKNTAPCILLSSLKIHKRNPNALVLVAPSDHWIEDEKAFQENILTSFETCKNREVLMTLGIQPTFPNTGYGYIQYDKHEAAVVKKCFVLPRNPITKLQKTFFRREILLGMPGFLFGVPKVYFRLFKIFTRYVQTLYNGRKPIEYY